MFYQCVFYISFALRVHVQFQNTVVFKTPDSPVAISDNSPLGRNMLDRYQTN